MANAIEQRGFFWWTGDPSRPSNSPQTAVPGLLTVTAEGRTSLEIDGALALDDEHADWTKPRTFNPRLSIVGMLDTAGDYVRLEEVERVDFGTVENSPQQQSFAAETCIKRDHTFPADYDHENYSELRIDLKGLEEWLQLDSLRAQRDYGVADGERELVSYTNHRFEFSIDDGTVSIESFTSGGSLFGLFGDHVSRKISFEQSFNIVYRPTLPSSLAQLQYVFAKIEQLLSLFLGSYFRLNRPHFLRKEEPYDQWDTIFTYSEAPSTEELNRFFFLVPFTEIRDQFGLLLQTWLTKSEAFGAGFYLYTASLRNQQTYSEDRLFALAAGIEALHRKGFNNDSSQSSQNDLSRAERLLALIPVGHPDKRWLERKLAHAHEPSLEQRLLECLRELPLRFGKSELEKFAKQCAGRRNDISHRGGPPAGTDYETFHNEITHLAEALSYLFHLLILYKIGLSEEAVLRAATKSWVAERLIKKSFEAVDLHVINKPLDEAS
jgi:hypothetical protein